MKPTARPRAGLNRYPTDEGRVLGDTTTLADANVVAKLKQRYEEAEEA